MMTRHCRLIIVFTVLLGALPLWGQQLDRLQRNQVAAVVNNTVITAGMVDDNISIPPNAQVLPDVMERFRASTLETLINMELVLQEYNEQKFSLPDSIFQQRIKEAMHRDGFPTRSSLVRKLKADGKTYEEYAREQREQIIRRIMLTEFASPKGIVISPRRIENYYIANKNQYRRDVQIRLQMIAISSQKHGAEASRQLADEIHTKLMGGDSFSEMASIYSDLYAETGGLRDELDKKGTSSEPGTLPKPLEDVAFSLERGQISEVIQHNNISWIIRCAEIQQQELRSLADVRDEIEKTLMDQEHKAREQKWYRKLRDKAYISKVAF